MLLARVSTALHVTGFKLCECFLLRTDRKHSTSSDFAAPDFGSSDALSSCRPAQSSAHWRVRLYARVAIDLQASRSHWVDSLFFARGQLTRRSLYFYPREKFFGIAVCAFFKSRRKNLGSLDVNEGWIHQPVEKKVFRLSGQMEMASCVVPGIPVNAWRFKMFALPVLEKPDLQWPRGGFLSVTH